MYARYVRVTPIGVFNFASMRLGILLREQFFKSCKEILNNNASTASGVYTIDPDGVSGTLPATNCYCDMMLPWARSNLGCSMPSCAT